MMHWLLLTRVVPVVMAVAALACQSAGARHDAAAILDGARVADALPVPDGSAGSLDAATDATPQHFACVAEIVGMNCTADTDCGSYSCVVATPADGTPRNTCIGLLNANWSTGCTTDTDCGGDWRCLREMDASGSDAHECVLTYNFDVGCSHDSDCAGAYRCIEVTR